MRQKLLLPLAAGLAACSGGGDAPRDGTPDATAETIATNDSAQIVANVLIEALGGATAWEDTRFVTFRWIVERDGEILRDRKHAWDRARNRYRLEHQTDGAQTLALFDIDSMKNDSLPFHGDVWLDGRKLEGAQRDSALERAYAVFINDSYWLLMPFKWRDPGVHLDYEGRRELSDGRLYPTVRLSFDTGLGVTEDEFWGFVDPETGLLAAWQYHLQDREEKDQIVWWDEWQQFGPILMSTDRRFENGNARIYFEDVGASTEVPESVFTSPDG